MFHRTIRTRQAQNLIREIRCSSGNIATTHLDIKREAERLFSEFLNHNPANYQGTSEEELQDLLKFRCTSEDCRMLEAEVIDKELRKVLFVMPTNKSGPDGFPCEFFKTTWSVLAHDFAIAVQSVFIFGFLPQS